MVEAMGGGPRARRRVLDGRAPWFHARREATGVTVGRGAAGATGVWRAVPRMAGSLLGSASFRARGLPVVWVSLGALTVVEAAGEILHPRGTGIELVFHDWLHDAGVVLGALLCVARVIADRRHRAAWAAIAGALLCFAAGEVLWSVLYGDAPSTADPNPTDAIYLAYYPLAAAGLVLLTRHRLYRFDFHRWIDGIAIVLIIATPGVSFVLEPVAAESAGGALADAVNFAYPLADILLVGAVLGVFGLTNWRPGRSWGWLGVGFLLMTIPDAVSTVQRLQGHYHLEPYDFLWTMGTAAIAYGAWSHPPARTVFARPVGWRAIALPLLAQGFAAAIQIYAFFHEIPRSERLLTAAVLLLGMVQIYVSRNHRVGPDADEEAAAVEEAAEAMRAAESTADGLSEAHTGTETPAPAGLPTPRATNPTAPARAQRPRP